MANVSLRRNKAAYASFVCPNCFRQLNKCVCDYFPPYSLIFIDVGVQQIIQTLHDKGYITTGCCESHYKGVCTTIYVTFNMPNLVDISTLPEGFKVIKQGYGIEFDYPRNITEQEFCLLKNEKLAELLQWTQKLKVFTIGGMLK